VCVVCVCMYSQVHPDGDHFDFDHAVSAIDVHVVRKSKNRIQFEALMLEYKLYNTK